MPKAKILYRSDSEESDCDDNFFNPPEKQDEPAVESLEENTEIIPPPEKPNATDAPKTTRKPRTIKAVKTDVEPVATEPVREGFICPFCYKPYKKKSYLDKHIEQNRCQKKQELEIQKIKKADEILEKEKIKEEKKTKRQIAKEKKIEKEKRIQQILEEQKAEEEAEEKAFMKQSKKAVVKKQTPKKPVKPRAKKNVEPIKEEVAEEPLSKPVLKRTPAIHNSTRFGSYRNRHLIPQNVIINFD